MSKLKGSNYMNFPSKGKNIFSDNGSYYDFAYIRWEDIELQFRRYIVGYKQSADLLIQNALSSQDIRILDTCIFPACFLYRQYLELSLKDIYLSYSNDTYHQRKETIQKSSHNLKAIWEKVKPIIKKYYPYDDKDILKAVENYIYQYSREDEKSYLFRYPITKDLAPVKNKEWRVNIKNLFERMNELEEFLTSVVMGIDAKRDFVEEMRTYYEKDIY